MELDTKIANIMTRFVDSKYAVDNIQEGWDCVNFTITFYEALGVEMPHEFEDWNLSNYGERIKKNPDLAHKTFERFVMILGKEVEPSYMSRGDLLLFRVKNFGVYAGVFLGNGNAFMMFNKGGRVIPLKPFRPFIIGCRRLL